MKAQQKVQNDTTQDPTQTIPETCIKFNPKSWQTRIETIRINKNKDGTIQLTILGDITHGDRTFTFASQDAQTIANAITQLTTTPR